MLLNNILKDNKDMKTQVENLKKEIDDTKELVNVLQNLTMNNSQKIFGNIFTCKNRWV